MKPRVVVLTGPTGIGKSDLAIAVANKWNCEIINGDASQIRKHLNIGTAKPNISQSLVTQHLFDIINATDSFSIKDYQKKAYEKINEILAKGKIPLIVGGSGLYIASLFGDYPLNEPTRDPQFAMGFSSLTDKELHELLLEKNPDKAQTIHPNNRRRVLRALELTLNPPVFEKIPHETTFEAMIICLTCDRDLIYTRINNRVESMFNEGWIEEVKQLIDMGMDISQIQEIGYREIKDFLDGKVTIDFVKQLIKQKTRNYAKRQITWFKNKLACRFVQMDFKMQEATLKDIDELIACFLNKEAL
ncbi:MAG: tRNA (adenosine(37)-N6)-dimethylallyltransferase MiaA [Bacilli bacterium]